MFGFLPQDGSSITVDDLLEAFKGTYDGPDKVPFNVRATLTGAIRTLRGKVEFNEEPFLIASAKRGGQLTTYWVAAR